MYCPRCGQQASAEVSFCSRCGLPLEDSAAVVEAGGRLAANAEEPRALTPRQRGTRKGLMIAAGGLLFFLIAFFLTRVKEDLFVFMPFAALLFTIGVMRMLYGLLLEDGGARPKASKPRGARAEGRAALEGARTVALPHARTRPAADFATRTDANTVTAPPSVAEATTSLLEDGGEDPRGAR